MARDNKYGRVTLEHGSIGEEEPVVVFRAQDDILIEVLDFYYKRCEAAGSPPRHLEIISETIGIVEDWQRSHDTKTPDSKTSTAWRP